MTTLSQMSVADRYREIARGFSALVSGTVDWDAPTPVQEWRARDVVGHLTTWFPTVLQGGTDLTLVPLPSAEDDPVAAWVGLDAQVQAILDDPATADVVFSHEHMGTLPLLEMIDRYFVSDVFFHSWDLARATGQQAHLEEDYVVGAHQGMAAIEPMLRESGQFGEQQPVPADATPVEQLMAFLGRDPRWTPPSPS